MISISSRMLLYLSLSVRFSYLTVIYTEKTWSNVTCHLNNFSDNTFKVTEHCVLRQEVHFSVCEGKQKEEIKTPKFCFEQLTLEQELILRLATALAKIWEQFSICIYYGHCLAELWHGFQTEVGLKVKGDGERENRNSVPRFFLKIQPEIPLRLGELHPSFPGLSSTGPSGLGLAVLTASPWTSGREHLSLHYAHGSFEMGALAARSKTCLAKAREDAAGRRLEDVFCNPALGLEGWVRIGSSLKGKKRGWLDPSKEASKSLHGSGSQRSTTQWGRIHGIALVLSQSGRRKFFSCCCCAWTRRGSWWERPFEKKN